MKEIYKKICLTSSSKRILSHNSQAEREKRLNKKQVGNKNKIKNFESTVMELIIPQ